MLNNKKVAITYDWLDKWGGVERVLLTLAEIFPDADFYTTYYDQKGASWAKNLKIKTSFIQKFPYFIRKNRLLSIMFYPFAFESFNFDQYDLLISVTSSFAKGIVTKPKTKHLCYLLTPTRFLWPLEKTYFTNKIVKKIVDPYLNYLKKWDYIAAQRPDKIISISKTVANRCQKYYQRKTQVVYPPFDIDYWNNIKNKIKNLNINKQLKLPQPNSQRIFTNVLSELKSAKAENSYSSRNLTIKEFREGGLRIEQSDFFLVVSRLEPYKKTDLVIKTFNILKDKKLIIVGSGSQKTHLKKIVKSKNIYFLQNLTDEELAILYSKAIGLIIPQEEDFGYVSLEGQFFTCPIIAYQKGGITETVIKDKTGIFFNNQTEKDLKDAIERYDKIKYNLKNNLLANNINYLKKFDKNIFKEKILKIIEKINNKI